MSEEKTALQKIKDGLDKLLNSVSDHKPKKGLATEFQKAKDALEKGRREFQEYLDKY